MKRFGTRVVCLLAFLTGLSGFAFGQKTNAVVHVAVIDGTIDLGLAPFVKRVLDQAAAEQAAAVVLEINTLGGRVDAAIAIRDTLLNSPVRTIAFVNKRAISAGALIALACQQIIMADGGTIGAAAPVQAGQQGKLAQPVEEKTVSYVRKEFRATAESRKRPPLVAEAMVDADVAIPGLVEKGKLLTLTTSEALAQKVADFSAESMPQLLERAGLPGAEVRPASPNWAENVVRFLTHPILSSLLVTIGMLGIVVELRTPGFGFAGAIGVASLALFFWGHWLVQLAGWEELLLVSAGLILIALEIFVIPGFGIAGVLGIAALLAGLTFSVLGQGPSWATIVTATARIVFSLLAALLGSLVLLRYLPRLPGGRRLVLKTTLGSGVHSEPESFDELPHVGEIGIASSPLRPAGIAVFKDRRVDVVAEGELIEPGQSIEVIRTDGNRVVVRRINRTLKKEQQP